MSDESKLILIVMLSVAATMFLVGLMVMSFVSYNKEKMLLQQSKVSEMAKEELVKRVLQNKPYLVDPTRRSSDLWLVNRSQIGWRTLRRI